MPEEPSTKSSPLKLIGVVVLFVAIFFAIKFVFGIAMAILKWVAIGAVALLVTWWLLRSKSGDGKSGAG